MRVVMTRGNRVKQKQSAEKTQTQDHVTFGLYRSLIISIKLQLRPEAAEFPREFRSPGLHKRLLQGRRAGSGRLIWLLSGGAAASRAAAAAGTHTLSPSESGCSQNRK